MAKIEVRTSGETPPEGSWVRIIGTWVPSEKPMSDEGVPIIATDDITPVEEPRQPYE